MRKPIGAMTLQRRMTHMLIGWGAVGLVYGLFGLRSAEEAVLITPSAFDRWVSFSPAAVWPYLSFFLFVPLGFLQESPLVVAWLRRAFLFSAAGAGLVFALFPTTMHFPPVSSTGLSAEAVRLLMMVDSEVNSLPSLHATLTALVLVAVWQPGRVWRNSALTLWALSILSSILILHRHQLVDLLAGLALAALAGSLAQIYRRRG